MIRFQVAVYDKEGNELEREEASGNTLRTARAAVAAIKRHFENEYSGATVKVSSGKGAN